MVLKLHLEISERRQGHRRFATEPKQSKKGHRQLPGNTIPVATGNGEEENINQSRLISPAGQRFHTGSGSNVTVLTSCLRSSDAAGVFVHN